MSRGLDGGWRLHWSWISLQLFRLRIGRILRGEEALLFHLPTLPHLCG